MRSTKALKQAATPTVAEPQVDEASDAMIARGHAVQFLQRGMSCEQARGELLKIAEADGGVAHVMLRLGIHQAVHEAASNMRSVAKRPDGAKGSLGAVRDDVSGVVRHIERNLMTLYDSPLPGSGKPLGEAMADDLRASIQLHAAQVRGHMKSSTWLSMVLKVLPAKQKVRDALSLEQLRTLQQKAEKQVNEKFGE